MWMSILYWKVHIVWMGDFDRIQIPIFRGATGISSISISSKTRTSAIVCISDKGTSEGYQQYIRNIFNDFNTLTAMPDHQMFKIGFQCTTYRWCMWWLTCKVSKIIFAIVHNERNIRYNWGSVPSFCSTISWKTVLFSSTVSSTLSGAGKKQNIHHSVLFIHENFRKAFQKYHFYSFLNNQVVVYDNEITLFASYFFALNTLFDYLLALFAHFWSFW